MQKGDCIGIRITQLPNGIIKIIPNFVATLDFLENSYNGRELIVPLFLFPEHGEFINILYNICKLSLPFLALSSAIRDINCERNDRNEFIFSLLEETCKYIYKNTFAINPEDNIPNVLNTQLEDFNNNPTKIHNNELFISYLFVAKLCGDFKIKPGAEVNFCQIIVEEEARRSLRNAKNIVIPANMMFRILNVDTKKWVSSYVKRFKKHRMEQIDSNNGTLSPAIYKEDMEFMLDPSTFEIGLPYSDYSTWEPNVQIMSKLGGNLYQKVYKDYTEYGLPKLAILPLLFRNLAFDINIDSLSNEQKLAMTIQIFLHTKEDVRSNAIKNRTYVNIFNKQEAIQYLKLHFVDYIKREKMHKFLNIKNEYDLTTDADKAKIFGSTIDLTTAAGVLYGAYIGVNVQLFAQVLQQFKCPLAKEKIKMLLTGQFKGIDLYKDGKGWKPSRKNCFKLWSKNWDIMTHLEWKHIFDLNKCDHSVGSWIKYEKQVQVQDQEINYVRND